MIYDLYDLDRYLSVRGVEYWGAAKDRPTNDKNNRMRGVIMEETNEIIDENVRNH